MFNEMYVVESVVIHTLFVAQTDFACSAPAAACMHLCAVCRAIFPAQNCIDVRCSYAVHLINHHSALFISFSLAFFFLSFALYSLVNLMNYDLLAFKQVAFDSI